MCYSCNGFDIPPTSFYVPQLTWIVIEACHVHSFCLLERCFHSSIQRLLRKPFCSYFFSVFDVLQTKNIILRCIFHTYELQLKRRSTGSLSETNDRHSSALGCPKKPKSPNFGSQLTPLVFLG